MFAKLPTLPAAGVPCSRPLDAVKVAHTGLFAMLKVSVLPFASLAVGWNEYATPTVAVVAGAPEMTGATLTAETTIVNAGNEAETLPSLTLITMLANEPMFAAAGVPCSSPVVALNCAQAGR